MSRGGWKNETEIFKTKNGDLTIEAGDGSQHEPEHHQQIRKYGARSGLCYFNSVSRLL